MALTPSATRLLEVVVLAVVYYVAGRLGQFLAIPPGNVTAVWAPSGIALAAVLLYGNRVWPGIWLGSFFGNTWAFFDPTNNWTVVTSSAVGASIGMGATLQALASAFFLQRLGIIHSLLDRARDFLKFVGLAGVIGCTVSATIGVTSLCLGGFASWEDYAWTWGTWWLGDTAGVLMVTPLILAWNSESLSGWTARKATEAVLLLGLTIALMPIAFENVLGGGAVHTPLQFILLPLLVWSTFRFGQFGTTTLIGVIAVGGIWATAHGFGPFARDSVNESLLLMQAFMGVYTVTLLAMAAVITERKQTEETLREQKERFHLVINYANDAIFYLALDGTIQWVSRQATVLTGKPVAELLGRSITSILTREGAVLAEARLAAIRRGESVPPLVEFEILHPDGSAVWVETNITSVLEDGTVVGRLLVARDITERKRVKEALQESEARFRAFMDNSSVVAWIKDAQGRYVYVNRPFELRHQRTFKEIRGKTDFDLRPEETAKQFQINDQYVLSSGKTLETFETAALPDAGPHWLVYKFLIEGASGQRLVGGIGIDITERKRAEESLQVFRVLLDQVRDSIEVIDPQTGRFIDGNEKAWSNLGYARNELLSITVPDIDPLVTKTVFASNMQWLRETGKTLLLDSIHLRKDGTTFPVEVSAQLVQYGKEKEYVVAIVRDITERKQAEEALQQIHQKHQELVNTIAGIVWEADAQTFQFSYVSQKAERILGYPLAQWLNEPTFWADHIHPDDRERTVALCINATKEMRDHVFECRMLAADGHTVWLQDIVTVVVENNQAVKLRGVMVDITERKRMEVDREDLYKRLQESHKGLRTLSQRLLEAQELERRRIARELHDETGQTLTSLLIGMRTLEEMPMREAVRKRVSELRKTASRAINEIKRLALGLHPSVLDDLGLETALTRLTEGFVHAHGLMVDLHMNGLDGHRLPLAVETTLYRIVQEALTNVAKHAGGARVSVLLQCSPSAARVIIEDDGRGFDVQTVLKSAGRLNRMGLHGMRERAALLNGSIEIESTPGGGTTIYAQVPIGRGSA